MPGGATRTAHCLSVDPSPAQRYRANTARPSGRGAELTAGGQLQRQ